VDKVTDCADLKSKCRMLVLVNFFLKETVAIITVCVMILQSDREMSN
jgi:hypothetical protein